MLHTVEHGSGAPTLVLIHGWTCDHTAMAPVARAFSHAHRCISVDLLGHGASPKSDSYTIEAQACALLACMPHPAILIGHSMGAQVAIEAAVLAPNKIAAIILLDPAQIVPIEKSRLFGEGMRSHLNERSPREVLAAFAGNQAVQPVDLDESEASVAQMLTTDEAVVRAAWTAIVDWQGAVQLRAVQCPTLVIAIDKPINKLVDLAKANKMVMTGQVVGSGHSLQFEVMDQVVPMIRRFLRLNKLDLFGL
jgi:pimeloyl-ACP methyl ester carboxylesterase